MVRRTLKTLQHLAANTARFWKWIWPFWDIKGINIRNKLATEAVARRYSVKKVFLKISLNSQENTCTRVFFWIKLQALACNFIKKDSGTVVSREFCKIFEKTIFYRTPPMAASETNTFMLLYASTFIFEYKIKTLQNKIYYIFGQI